MGFSGAIFDFLKRIPLDEFAAERSLPYDFIHEGMTLLNLFDADISGRNFEHDKPHPMIFLTAPQELGCPHEHCFVVADASSKVQAGEMAALGVARLNHQMLLNEGRLDRSTIH